MATERQIAANKSNAQKSTGPTSAEGKAKSSRNRLSWGFASSATIMPGEDPEEFKALLDALTAEHQPITETEQILVEKMATNQWLSLRAFRLQGYAFLGQSLSDDKLGIPKELALLIRYHTAAERAFHKAHNELIKAKKQRPNSEFGFEPQNLDETPAEPVEAAPVAPPQPPKTGIPTFTAEELDFELCPEALEFLKKVA